MFRTQMTGLRFLQRIATALVLVMGVSACQRDAPSEPTGEEVSQSPDDDSDETATGAESPLAPVLGTLPSFALIDQTESAFGSVELRDKVWIANFIFTRCRSTCPQQTTRMAQLQHDFKREPFWDEIRLVSFSVDPEYDRPEVLNAYAERYFADDEHWRFLTGARDDIWALSKQGFHLPVADDKENTAMPILHDTKFILVDRQGRIRGYFESLSEDDIDRLKSALDVVLAEQTPAESVDDPAT